VAAGKGSRFLQAHKPVAPDTTKHYRDIFERSSRQFIKNYLGNKYGSFALDFPLTGHSPSFAALDTLLERAAARGTQVSLFIYPSHAWEYELIHRAGIWKTFENWKRRLAKAVDRHATRSPSLFQLVDFSGYNCVTQEEIPDFGGMQWHWDVAHFNQYSVGPAILLELLQRNKKDRPNPIAPCELEGFGKPLTPGTVETVIQEMHKQRAAYVASRPVEMNIIDRLWSERRIRTLQRHLW
jgi:hypothetical protein